jgi:hypothetical protein
MYFRGDFAHTERTGTSHVVVSVNPDGGCRYPQEESGSRRRR